MSTRSFIGILGEDGAIRAVYCHSDGYPSYVGQTLLDHYQSAAKIAGLINLGDLSCIGPELGEKHPFGPVGFEGDVMKAYDDYEAKYGHMCRAYGRDRDKENVAAKTYKTERTFLNGAKAHDAKYAYLYRGGEWLVWDLAPKPRQVWSNYTSVANAIKLTAHSY